jgi:hypothetical protein
MNLPGFTSRLLSEGHAAVESPEDIPSEDQVSTAHILAEFEQIWRLGMPGEAPEFQSEVAVWAARQFYRACQYVLFRNEDNFDFQPLACETELQKLPSAHYSADLTFRFLPDVIKQVRITASEDPLLSDLLCWAHSWPLSSVGVEGVDLNQQQSALEAISRNPSLLRMYADRIIKHRDESRLSDDRIRQAVACAIGAHPGLAPHFAASLLIR